LISIVPLGHPDVSSRLGVIRTRDKEVVMKNSYRPILGFFADERGTEVLEWGLVCGLIVIGAIAAIAAIGPKVKGMWDNCNNAINAP
jgi:Flp pilus assembly pilin Flp